VVERDRVVIDDRDHTIRGFGGVDVRRFLRQDDRVSGFIYRVIEDL
jgi:hypothetical protein